VAVEIQVWDLDGASPYYKVTDKIVIPPKKVKQIMEMEYPTMKDAKPVYFLLLKLFRLSDKEVLSRNFYWLHLPGKDYKLLEEYRQKTIPLEIGSKISVTGSTYKVRMSVQNKSKKSAAESATSVSTMEVHYGNGVHTGQETTYEVQERSLWSKIRRGNVARSGDNLRIVQVNGTDSGVAFFLQFSVHTSEPSTQENYTDTRILPVHYSDNYFSLTPGEKMTVDISFQAPEGSKPIIILRGWNYHLNHAVTMLGAICM
jgi:mannosylglycoprotein endo-beta-mannosidase